MYRYRFLSDYQKFHSLIAFMISGSYNTEGPIVYDPNDGTLPDQKRECMLLSGDGISNTTHIG